MLTRNFFRALTAAACAVVSLPLGAQGAAVGVTSIEVPAATNSATATTPALGPQRDAAVAGIRVSAESQQQRLLDGATPPVVKTPQRTRGTSLMILGTAAFVAGLLIGKDVGTVMAVGGAVVGLYGLYIYLP